MERSSDDSDDSSGTESKDSEEEDLEEKLAILKKYKEKCQLNYNLDETLQPVNDNSDSEPETKCELDDALDRQIQAKLKVDMLNNAPNFSRALETIFPNLKRLQRRRAGLVQERPISPRTEEDKLRSKVEMKKYKETKEKLRRRKLETRRRQQMGETSADSEEIPVKPGTKPRIVDELDIINNAEVRKSVYEEWKQQEQKIKMEKKRSAEAALEESKAAKVRKLNIEGLSSNEERKIKERFRNDISGVIRQQLTGYMSESCQRARITSIDDFKHLARKVRIYFLNVFDQSPLIGFSLIFSVDAFCDAQRTEAL